MSQISTTELARRYDGASALWADKMRVLGYYDAYLGLLSHWPIQQATGRVLDVGAGTAAMAEAWVAVHGAPERLTLLDPSRPMLARGIRALERRGVPATCVAEPLRAGVVAKHDTVLAAHVIEHFADPQAALDDIATLTSPGGQLWLVVSKPHWCNAIIWLQWRHRTYREGQIATLLDRAGFDLTRSYDFPAGPPSRTSRGYIATKRKV